MGKREEEEKNKVEKEDEGRKREEDREKQGEKPRRSKSFDSALSSAASHPPPTQSWTPPTSTPD